MHSIWTGVTPFVIDMCNCDRDCGVYHHYIEMLSKVYIHEIKCFGCGVCRAACPNGAITLIPREESPTAKDIWMKEPKSKSPS